MIPNYDLIDTYKNEFDCLAATIPDIVYRIDDEGKFTYLNPAIRVLGYEPGELIGKHFSELILPADRKKVSRKYVLRDYAGKNTGSEAPKLFDERRSGARMTSQLVVRLVTRGGSTMPTGMIESIGRDHVTASVSSSGVYQTDALTNSKVFIGSVGVIKDITSQRWMESELIKYSEKLEGLVADRTRELTGAYNQLQKTLDGITRAIAATVELRDPYTAGHQVSVANLAKAIALEMKLPLELADQIYTAGLIHDIGKISIPAEILSKPGRLDKVEYMLIKRHPQAGHDILKNIDFPYPIARWILEHHELIDGSGYPAGLTGERISLESRIITVADVFEAMSSHRPYRASLGIGEAMKEINNNKGRLYDNDVVETCCRLFNEKGFKFKNESNQMIASDARFRA